MIRTENGITEVLVDSSEELRYDTQQIISAFIRFSLKANVPEDIIEKLLIIMIAEGFNDKGELRFVED